MDNSRSLVTLVLIGIALAMGVAVVVLNILKSASVETSIMLLGMGLFTLSLAALQERRG